MLEILVVIIGQIFYAIKCIYKFGHSFFSIFGKGVFWNMGKPSTGNTSPVSGRWFFVCIVCLVVCIIVLPVPPVCMDRRIFLPHVWWSEGFWTYHCIHIINNDPCDNVPDHCIVSDQLIWFCFLKEGNSYPWTDYSIITVHFLPIFESMDTSASLSMGGPWPRPGKGGVRLNFTKSHLEISSELVYLRYETQ